MASEAKRVNKIAQEWHVHRRRGLGPEDLIREKGEGHKSTKSRMKEEKLCQTMQKYKGSYKNTMKKSITPNLLI